MKKSRSFVSPEELARRANSHDAMRSERSARLKSALRSRRELVRAKRLATTVLLKRAELAELIELLRGCAALEYVAEFLTRVQDRRVTLELKMWDAKRKDDAIACDRAGSVFPGEECVRIVRRGRGQQAPEAR